MVYIGKAQISIIIPVLNSPLIDQTLVSLQRQRFDLDRVEIIIVGLLDSEPYARSSAVKMQFIEADVSVGEARNLGIEASSGKWLVFLDSDCICSEQWLTKLTEHLIEGWPVVGGGVSAYGGSFYATCYNIATFHEFLDILPPGPRNYLPTLNLTMWREVAEKVGPMDRELPRSEDIEWTVRIKKQGYPLYFEPRATVFHCPPTNLRRVLTKWFNTGYCSRTVRQRHPAQLETHWLLNSPAILLGISPLIGLIATFRIFCRHPGLLKFFYTFP
ncbi:MAG: glycosyltransferase, partial [Candidatus Kryptoniota bacterium]